MLLPRSVLPCLLTLLALAACHTAGPAPAPAPADPIVVPPPVEESPGSYRLESDRLGVEILLRAAGKACAQWGQSVDVLEAEPARDGRAAFVHYRCGPAVDDPHEQIE